MHTQLVYAIVRTKIAFKLAPSQRAVQLPEFPGSDASGQALGEKRP